MTDQRRPKNDILEWPLGSLDFSQGCIIMGILNVTPDSFSDGGTYMDTDSAIERALQMVHDGARIIDIGPESTRPGSKPVSAEQQIARAIPVIEKITQRTDTVVSIDTQDSRVAEAAIKAGASIINDVSAFGDPKMPEVAARYNAVSILMHMKGTPSTMQKEPSYDDVVSEVLEYLTSRIEYAKGFGLPAEYLMIDPGIGFGKTYHHNLELLKHLDRFCRTDHRVLVGTSRKKFIGRITGREIPSERLFGTAATVAASVLAGASIVRVHDVAEMAEVVQVCNAINNA
ncbi:Dihydropteroate synthase [Anaerohalosphaera lusitana]|uniref:Dihydropteroate synthase n=1 Tax=Anaerohalosphaera lusitana TaxID=1936003 RepID=A0A1U9NMG7_9BACT|nr:dihydropteroate synthase [Anaerohalosphaera lusitana]AQT69142.1 Dihydropteroate synthase [Anaerohalosphaera lusitana]